MVNKLKKVTCIFKTFCMNIIHKNLIMLISKRILTYPLCVPTPLVPGGKCPFGPSPFPSGETVSFLKILFLIVYTKNY